MSSKTLNTIIKVLLLSVIAIVPFLNTSSLYFPYISGKAYVFRLLVVLAFFFWIWLLLENSKSEARNPKPLLPFRNILVISLILFFLAQVFVSFFGVDPLLSFFSTIERMDGVLQYGFWLVYFLILISVFKKERDWKLFFYVFIIIAVLASLFAWFNYSSQIRLAALFGNSSYFAVFLLFAIGFCAIAIERKFINSRLNYLFFIPAALFIITLISTQTRGAYFGLAGGIFLFCLLTFLFLRPARNASPARQPDGSLGGGHSDAGGKENNKLFVTCGVILLLGVISITALFLARDSDFVQNTYILKRTTSVAKLLEDDTVRERFLTWQIAFKAFKEKPVFGWGPENFGSAFNKYYDYNIGKVQPWFDRAHNQPIDILATGGIVLFSFYLFWLAAAVYTIFRIGRPSFAEATAGKERKVLSFILGSIFFAYFLQGLFLFDILPTFLGLFPFLAFLVVVKQETRMNADKNTDLRELERINTDEKRINTDRNPRPSVFQSVFIGVVALFSLFIIWTTVFLPYKANIFALKFLVYTESGIYQGAKKILEQSFVIKSPYTFWEVRKRSGWQFVSVFDYNLTDETISENIEVLKEIYDYITPELERFIENRPYDPQIYFIAGKIYRLGSEKLGKNDLDKAEIVLRKGFNYSDRRMEYYNEMAQVLILEGKLKEGEDLVREHIKRISSDNSLSYVLLGHFYFAAEKYDLAWEQYEKAREVGFKFYEDSIEYSRYIKVAEEVGEYQKIVDMAQSYLKEHGQDADTYYNIAVGYLYLEEKEKAREFLLKAIELKKEYEEYRPFFE